MQGEFLYVKENLTMYYIRKQAKLNNGNTSLYRVQHKQYPIFITKFFITKS